MDCFMDVTHTTLGHCFECERWTPLSQRAIIAATRGRKGTIQHVLAKSASNQGQSQLANFVGRLLIVSVALGALGITPRANGQAKPDAKAPARLAKKAEAALKDLNRREWTIDGATRKALVYAPASATTTPSPLIFAFHGHGGTMQRAAGAV